MKARKFLLIASALALFAASTQSLAQNAHHGAAAQPAPGNAKDGFNCCISTFPGCTARTARLWSSNDLSNVLGCAA